MAPEIYRARVGVKYTKKVDVYSLGKVFCEILAKMRPDQNSIEAKQHQD
jgi:serine/threonine protein kinase